MKNALFAWTARFMAVLVNPVRRTSRAVALGLVVSAFGTTAAFADRCQYSDGGSDYGPCMQFENNSDGNNFDLWCQRGPTSSSHKIVMEDGDSFTCKVPGDGINIGRTLYNNIERNWDYNCPPGAKRIVKLAAPGSPGKDGRWETECKGLH